MPRASDPNHASAEEIEPFEPLSRTKPIRRCTAPSSPPKEAVRPARPPQTSANKAAAPGSQDTQASRLHEEDEKLDIFRQYHAWVLGGKLTSQSPIKGLVKKYSCNKQYPKRLYDKVLKSGSTKNKWAGGRPGEFSPGCWDAMIKIIRDARPTKKVATARKIHSELHGERDPAEGRQLLPRVGARVACRGGTGRSLRLDRTVKSR